MRRSEIPYSKEELAWIKARKKMTRRKLHAAFCSKFNRDDVSYENMKCLCKRKGWLTGRTGGKGHKGWKSGHGGEFLSVDGYTLMRTILAYKSETGKSIWVFKHRWLWEKTHGPIPKGYCLKCLSDNKADARPENWKLIPSGMRSYLNGPCGREYDNAPPELKPMIMATAELEYKARKAKECRV